MADDRKTYLLQILIKRMLLDRIMRASIDMLHEMCCNTYPKASPQDTAEIRAQYTVDQYEERVIPILDKQFSLAEVQELIRFYSSPLGKKTLDPDFLRNMQLVSQSLSREIEQKYSMSHARNSKKENQSGTKNS